MDYKIVERNEFQVVGKTVKVSTKDGESTKRIPKFWDECRKDGTIDKLCAASMGNALLGICIDMELEKEQFIYMIAVESNYIAKSSDLTVRTIPSATWAVFTSIGPLPGAVQKVIEKIYQEWIPATGYEHAEAPELEVYPEGNIMAEDYRCEVWIPVVKK